MRNRKFVVVLLLLLMLVQLGTVGASAADYTFTVRVFSGNCGDFTSGDSEVMVFSNRPYGSTVTIDLNKVRVNDARYYVQGIRLAGHDNDALQPATITVTEDVDYVIAYGIAGNLVEYTVNYVNAATGNPIAESATYYGNVGDKPVIAFLYVDGYEPQAYSLTKTLSENAAENVFTFQYRELVTYVGMTAEEPEEEEEEEEEIIVPPAPAPIVEEPEELIDLDEDRTPTGNMVMNADGTIGLDTSGAHFAWSVIVFLCSIIGLGLLLLFLLKRKKDDDENEAEGAMAT